MTKKKKKYSYLAILPQSLYISVSLTSHIGDHLKVISWKLEDRSRSNLILVMTATRVRLIDDCKRLHWHSMVGRHDLMSTLLSQHMALVSFL